MSKVDAGNDGQHRDKDFYHPLPGQKHTISEKARVGNVSGGEQQMSVPKPGRSVMIDTTTGSAGPRAVGEIASGDDK